MLETINQKYMKLLFEIKKKPKSLSHLSKKSEITLTALSTLTSRLAREGAIIKEKGESKEIEIRLTEYGKKQVKLLEQIYENHKSKSQEEKNGKSRNETELRRPKESSKPKKDADLRE